MALDKGIVKAIKPPRGIKLGRQVIDLILGLRGKESIHLQVRDDRFEILDGVQEGDVITVSYDQFARETRGGDIRQNNAVKSILKDE